MHKNKEGNVLLITIIVMLVISLFAITSFTVVYRYSSIINKRYEKLQEEVYDDGTSASLLLKENELWL